MTDKVNHLGATLQDFLDGRLDDTRLVEVRAHLDGCPQCRSDLEALRWVRDVALKQLPGEEVPPALAARVAAALDAADGRTRPAARWTSRWWWRWATAGALLAAAAVTLLLLSRPRADLVDAVARDFAEYSNGILALDLRSSDGTAVESLYARGGIDFPTRVFDLGMMGYRLVGGRIHRLRGRPSALFAYRGPEGRDLVCQMFEGRLAELPAASTCASIMASRSKCTARGDSRWCSGRRARSSACSRPTRNPTPSSSSPMRRRRRSDIPARRELLLICAYCKRIRDDPNAWGSLEVFIEKRSEARFSHCCRGARAAGSTVDTPATAQDAIARQPLGGRARRRLTLK